jgi:hypothetical protein
MSDGEPWVPIHWQVIRPEGEFMPQLPNPAYLPWMVAYMIVGRGLTIASESTLNRGLADDLRVTIAASTIRGTYFPGGVWEMNYPRNEWFCDLLRTLGARATP